LPAIGNFNMAGVHRGCGLVSCKLMLPCARNGMFFTMRWRRLIHAFTCSIG
jgi:hypothetical protein